jgi:glycosyltransferase involved in cell wall biosynthesis
MDAGAVGPPSALDELVNALTSVPEHVQRRLLVLMIDGGTERRTLEQSAALLEDWIRFPGEVEQAAAQAIGRCCDAGIVLRTNRPAYQFRTSPQKLVMYLACGLPVICATAQIEHPVGRERLGWLAAPSKPALLGTALESMADVSRRELTAMGVRARAYVATVLGCHEITKRCLEAVLPETVTLDRGSVAQRSEVGLVQRLDPLDGECR